MTNTILKWTACVVTLAGAIATSLQMDPVNILLLNTGAVLYLMWAWRIREWNLIVINVALITIYVVGLLIRG
jgi:hypothetical protein